MGVDDGLLQHAGGGERTGGIASVAVDW